MYFILRLILLWQTVVMAQTPSLIPDNGGGCDLATGDIKADCIPKFIVELIKTIFGLTGGIFLVLLMIGGYRIMIGKALGDTEGGKNMVKWAIIGFFLSACTFFIIDFIISTIAGL